MKIRGAIVAVACAALGACGHPSPWWDDVALDAGAGSNDAGFSDDAGASSDAGVHAQALTGCHYIGGLNRLGVRGYSPALDVCAKVVLFDAPPSTDAGLSLPAHHSVERIGASVGACEDAAWAEIDLAPLWASGSIQATTHDLIDFVDVTLAFHGGTVHLTGSAVAATDSCL